MRRTEWKRPAKFAFVGTIGIVVQIATLHGLVGIGCGYLLATVMAVEAALLHNFVWHEKFTWRDRNQLTPVGLGSRCSRFHLSNGLISMTGNVLLMRMFVGGLGMRVLSANLLSITFCCFTNFLASDRWVFIAASPAGTAGARSR